MHADKNMHAGENVHAGENMDGVRLGIYFKMMESPIYLIIYE